MTLLWCILDPLCDKYGIYNNNKAVPHVIAIPPKVLDIIITLRGSILFASGFLIIYKIWYKIYGLCADIIIP